MNNKDLIKQDKTKLIRKSEEEPDFQMLNLHVCNKIWLKI